MINYYNEFGASPSKCADFIASGLPALEAKKNELQEKNVSSIIQEDNFEQTHEKWSETRREKWCEKW